MADALKNPEFLAAMRKTPPTSWDLAGIPQVNQGMGLMGPGAANAYAGQMGAQLPPTVQRTQGGFGLSPQFMGLLSQIAQPQQAAPMPQQPAFNMRPPMAYNPQNITGRAGHF